MLPRLGCGAGAAADLLARAQAGEPLLAGPRDARHVVLGLGRLERQRPLELAEVLGGHGHRHAHPAAAEQRPDAADRDLLDGRGAVGAAVVGEERDLRVGLARRRVEQRVHRLVVALLPGLHELLDRRAAVVGVELGAHDLVAAVPDRRQDHEQHEQDRQRRPAATPPPACVLGRGKEQRTGPGRVPERSGTTSTSAGHQSVVLAGPPDLLPSGPDEHGRIRR